MQSATFRISRSVKISFFCTIITQFSGAMDRVGEGHDRVFSFFSLVADFQFFCLFGWTSAALHFPFRHHRLDMLLFLTPLSVLCPQPPHSLWSHLSILALQLPTAAVLFGFASLFRYLFPVPERLVFPLAFPSRIYLSCYLIHLYLPSLPSVHLLMS